MKICYRHPQTSSLGVLGYNGIMFSVNSSAPAFSAPDQSGRLHHLQDYRDKWVLLYFYPKDDTPGCTKEACNFRDNSRVLQKMGVTVLGVSKDSVISHQNFAGKYNLNFPILSDEDKTIIVSYEAWGLKKFMGKEYEGVKRISYLIDPKGTIAKAYDHVNPLTHAKEVVADLTLLTKSSR